MTKNNRVAKFLLHIIPFLIHLAALCRLATEDLGGDFRMIQFLGGGIVEKRLKIPTFALSKRKPHEYAEGPIKKIVTIHIVNIF